MQGALRAWHGSAPDIAGKDLAKPLACILSFAMMLRYSFEMAEEADLVEKNGARRALAAGVRSSDIAQPNSTRVSTRVMGDRAARARKGGLASSVRAATIIKII